MKVKNVHVRRLKVPAAAAGALMDTLASGGDRLWPDYSWPPMRFDRPLAVGATGGHGPIRYAVEAYEPGRLIRFRFLAPRGFNGFHAYEVVPDGGDAVVLRHVLEMHAQGPAVVTWPLVFRPMHDALTEDSLARAEASLGLPPTSRRWSPWVKVLRWVMSRGTAGGQIVPGKTVDSRGL